MRGSAASGLLRSQLGKWLFGRRLGVTRRLRAELYAQGYPVGRGRIRRALAAAGLRAQQPRAFVPRTTDSDPNVRAAPNLLLGQAAPTAPNHVWVGDIT
jgi:putative transposase